VDTWTLTPLDGGEGVRLRGLGPEVFTVSLTRTAR
jgi:hypothetical protein